MTKADDARELAGYVAPIVRGTSEALLRRRVKTYDRETGEVTGEVTMRQVIGGLAEVTKLEIEVIDGKRPRHFTCDTCGKVFEVPKTRIPKTCDACRTGGQTVCPCGCGKAPPANAFAPSILAARGGGPWVCRVAEVACELCGKMVPTGAHGPLPKFCRSSDGGCERQVACAGGCGKSPPRKAFHTHWVAARGGAPWQCASCLKRAWFAQMTPDERMARSAKLRSVTSEQRSAASRLAASRMTPEERAERAGLASRARWAKMTPERRAEEVRKRWETRRAKAAAVLSSPDGGAEKTGADD